MILCFLQKLRSDLMLSSRGLHHHHHHHHHQQTLSLPPLLVTILPLLRNSSGHGKVLQLCPLPCVQPLPQDYLNGSGHLGYPIMHLGQPGVRERLKTKYGWGVLCGLYIH